MSNFILFSLAAGCGSWQTWWNVSFRTPALGVHEWPLYMLSAHACRVGLSAGGVSGRHRSNRSELLGDHTERERGKPIGLWTVCQRYR